MTCQCILLKLNTRKFVDVNSCGANLKLTAKVPDESSIRVLFHFFFHRYYIVIIIVPFISMLKQGTHIHLKKILIGHYLNPLFLTRC